jgi:carotenoid cleavage dioxygenase-like enzyme
MAISIQPTAGDHVAEPYLRGPYEAVHSESTIAELDVLSGEIPADLEGLFVRNGSNPAFDPPGRYHWFDGDGMVHGVHFAAGSASYRNRWVRTTGLEADLDAGGARLAGILEQPDFSVPGGPFKDTANTDLVTHAGRLFALWWLSGAVHELDPATLETLGVCDFGGTLDVTMNAHPKVDPTTGEMVFTSYSMLPPFLHMGVVGPDGTVTHLEAIDLPGPRLQHDLAITPRYTVLLDMSMMFDPAELARGRTKVRFFRDLPSRIGVVPRHGTNADVRWFEVDPFFMYHVVNAHESGDEVILHGCRMADPLVGDASNAATAVSASRTIPHLGHLRLEPVLWQWRCNLVTGAVTEGPIDDTVSEFPRINDRFMGLDITYSYSPTFADRPTLAFDGLVRHNLASGATTTHHYDDGWLGNEAVFAPSSDPRRTGESDGYLVTFVTNEHTGASEVHVFDPTNLAAGPVTRLGIPVRVPLGYHTEWVPEPGTPVASTTPSASTTTSPGTTAPSPM